MSETCFSLTKAWYGTSGNISAFYEWFIEAQEEAGLFAYKWVQVPSFRSDDGWVKIVNGAIRATFYVDSKAEEKDIQARGGVSSSLGESAIDNTVLANVMRPEEAKLMLASGHIRHFVIHQMAAVQRKHLHDIGQLLGIPDFERASPELVSKSICSLTQQQISSLKLDMQSFPMTFLSNKGYIVSNWGQIPVEYQKQTHNYVMSHLSTPTPTPSISPDRASSAGTESKASAPTVEFSHQLEEFLAFVKAHPGRLWKNDKREHKRLLLASLWSNELTVQKRSFVETKTMHRYIPLPWKRTVPLLTIDEKGVETVKRRLGDREYSRVRKNGFPYANSHGMSVTTGGVEEGLSVHGTLAFELGLPSDGDAKLGNWFITDIEKICAETSFLNPAGRYEDLLPGEEFHDVGQNPQIGSSIGATQHTQITRASLSNHQVYLLKHRPQWCELGFYVDIVQVGEQEDAFFVKLTMSNAYHEPAIRLLQQLRIGLMREFGGHSVDFNVKGLADTAGGFVITFGVITQLQIIERSVSLNPDTKIKSSDVPLPQCCTDTLAAAGGFLISDHRKMELARIEGRRCLVTLYDFTRKPGARRFVRRFLLANCGFIDGNGQSVDSDARLHRAEPNTTIFSSLFSYDGFRLTPTLHDCLGKSVSLEAQQG